MDTQYDNPAAASPGPAPARGRQRTELMLELEREIERLYRSYRRELLDFMRRNGISPADAEEPVNDAFLGAFREMTKKGRPLDEPRPFLFKVASNQMRDYWRRQHRRQRGLDRVQEIEQAGARLDQPDATAQIDDLDELAGHRALSGLPARQREAFVLHHCYAFEPAEIADVMGLSINTVRTHLERAHKKLTDLAGMEAS